jgi:hypothetical protein
VKRGYWQNIVPCFDHFSVNSDEIKMYANDFSVDEIVRFENTSDPDDQAILYAISAKALGVKGVYVDSYGLYHDSLSPEILSALCRPPKEMNNQTDLKLTG